MKKNKKSLKKLSLNKKVVSSLEENQVSGGTINTIINCPQSIICPVTVNCLTLFCPTKLNCPTLGGCPTFGGCPSLAGGCPTTY